MWILILSGTNERTFEETQQEKTVALGRRTTENGRKVTLDNFKYYKKQMCHNTCVGDSVKMIDIETIVLQCELSTGTLYTSK